MQRFALFEQFSPFESRFRRAATCQLRRIWCGKMQWSPGDPHPSLPVPVAFKFAAIPRTYGALLQVLERLAAAPYRPIRICLPQDTSHNQKLRFTRAVYQCCAARNIEGFLVLMVEPMRTVNLFSEQELRDKESIVFEGVHDHKYGYTVLGGTFDRLHYGHKLFLSEAAMITALELTVGVTTSKFNKSKELAEMIEPWRTRAQNICDFVRLVCPMICVRCVPLDDIYGPAVEPAQELLVVTQETEVNVASVQSRREELGLARLEVYTANLLESAGGNRKISSSQKRRDLVGKLVKPPKQRDLRSYVIGITGRSCSGKSSVAGILKSLGAQILDLDLMAHHTYRPVTPVYSKLVEVFGRQILEVDEENPFPPINRHVLGAIVFGHKENMSKLCSLVWPVLKERVKDELKKADNKVIVLEGAVLIEAGLLEFVDELWVCAIDRESCVQRMIQSRRMLYSDATKRLDMQLSDEEYATHANLFISTRGAQSETADLVRRCWEDLKARVSQRRNIDWSLLRADRAPYDQDSAGAEGDDEGGDTTEEDSSRSKT